MLGFVLQRVLATIPVMAVVALVVFLLLRLSPGDPAAVIAGDYATAEQIAELRTQLGLDQPLHVQFFTWLGQILRGNIPMTRELERKIRQRLYAHMAKAGIGGAA